MCMCSIQVPCIILYAFFRFMGANWSSSSQSTSQPAAGLQGCPVDHSTVSGCPVDHSNMNPNVMMASASECPAAGDAGFDTRNMMPHPNQKPAPDQPFPLSTTRQKSSIPKAEPGPGPAVWEYPSPQMFWNAMLRKGWRWQDDQMSQGDMDAIIQIHNANNERAWLEILKWERFLHGSECAAPKLRSFKGNAKKLTPRARVRNWMGYELPFDRHDWMVDRCGKEVHYVIDYYDGGAVDPKSFQFAALDVRPAMDSFGNIWDRMTASYWRLKSEYLNIHPDFAPQNAPDEAR